MNEFWNPDSFSGTRTVDVYIRKIRAKDFRTFGKAVEGVKA